MSFVTRGYIHVVISALAFCTALMCFKLDLNYSGVVWLFNSGVWFAAGRLAFRIADGSGPDE